MLSGVYYMVIFKEIERYVFKEFPENNYNNYFE